MRTDTLLEEKIKMEDRCLKVMMGKPQYCNDNTHLLACEMLRLEFGTILTPNQITFLRSVDRARQKVLKRFPAMDLRTKAFDEETAHIEVEAGRE